jgi:outer membrane receptor for ferrienterochelin and colicins
MAITRTALTILLLAFAATQAIAQSGSISGRVASITDDKSEPLIGAIVLIQGSVRGTTTNVKGEYKIADLPPGRYTVQVSMIGYQKSVRPNILVEAGKDAAANFMLNSSPVQIDQVVVTASKRAQSLEEVPVSLSVLDATEIRQRNAMVLDDALRYIPGVNMTGFQVNIRGSSGYSRGAGSRVLMLLDGIPFITGDTGELNFETVPIGQVDRIEVVKGASSALYGSNALGGVINIITKGIPETPSTVVRFFGGMYNKPTYQQWEWSSAKDRFLNGQSISHAYRSGDLGVSLFASRQFDDGYRANDYRRRYNFFVKVKEDYTQSSALTMTFGLLYQYGGQYLYWRSLDSALIPTIPQANDNVKSIRYFTTAQYNTVIDEGFGITTRAMWFHNDWGFETRAGIGRAESVADDFRLQSEATLIPNTTHTLTFGIDGNVDLVGGDVIGQRLLGGFAVFAQDEIGLAEPLTLTLGARYDFTSVGVTSPGGSLNPKIALAYTPLEGTTVRASYGRAFRVPSVAEAFLMAGFNNIIARPNEDLKPERSSSYEVGVSQRLGEFGTFDLAAFRSDFTNLIEVMPAVEENALRFQWQNVADARIQGVETSLKLGLFNGALQYNLGYTYVWPEDLTEHDILKYRPRHLFYTTLSGNVGPLHASADFRYISRVDRIDDILGNYGIVLDAEERVQILVTDFRLGVDFPIGRTSFTATASVNNAFQYNYVELIGNLMPPRTYMLVLEARM